MGPKELFSHRINITNIDVRTAMDNDESTANWTQCMEF